MKPLSSFSRRNFLRTLAATGLASGSAFAAPSPTAQPFNEVHDLVIVGSGFAGLSAAYAALKAGVKDILILDKMEAFGGNSCLCGGLMSVPLNPKQQKQGIKDSVDLMVADMTKAGRGFNHPDLARKFAENAVNICPMLDECGVQLMDKVIRLGGHSAPRTMVPTAASGGGIVVPIHNWLKKNGVQFRNRSQVIDLLMQDGKVTGVLVNCDYNWKDGTSKKEQRIGSRGGIVVATGGWGQDKDFIKTTMPVYSLLECTSDRKSVV